MAAKRRVTGTLGRLRRHAASAWLGILALAIQALVPVLLAAEIPAMAASGETQAGAMAPCPMGAVHNHVADDPQGGPHENSRHPAPGLAHGCPICLALHAWAAFTPPPPPALPAPSALGRSLVAAALRPTLGPGTPASYQPRGPPASI